MLATLFQIAVEKTRVQFRIDHPEAGQPLVRPYPRPDGRSGMIEVSSKPDGKPLRLVTFVQDGIPSEPFAVGDFVQGP